VTLPVLHLPMVTRKGALCGATSGRVVDPGTFKDSREGQPCGGCIHVAGLAKPRRKKVKR
jgi:hypothetical protein